tara:strand:+ start:454 stop:999 length:546 start_codon:yes stop_codon:yes gene_type:complete
MVFKTLIVFWLITFSSTLFASDDQSELKLALHNISGNIDKFTNYELVNNSVYEHIRPRANITNKELSSKEIDDRTYKYVSEKYAPILVKNYSQIYSEMRQENKDFTQCESYTPIKPNEDILKSLCLEYLNGNVTVKYMTNGYSQGWSTAASFSFSYINGVTELTSIELQSAEGQKFYVEGI